MTRLFIEKYADLLETLDIPPVRKLSYFETMQQICKDLRRLRFLGTQEEFNSCVNLWMAPQRFQPPYRQENQNASIVLRYLKKYWMEKFEEPEEPQEITYISLAYFDKDKELCGLTIAYIEGNPSVWLAGVIRYPHLGLTNEDPMRLTGSDNLLHFATKILPDSYIKESFLEDLNATDEVHSLFQSIINDDGTLNTVKFSEIEAQIEERSAQIDHDSPVDTGEQTYNLIRHYFLKHFFPKNVKTLKEREESIDFQEAFLVRLYDQQLESQLNKTFLKRHIHSFRLIGLALLGSLGIVALSGFLAPLGALAAGFAFALSNLALPLVGFSMFLMGIKIAYDAHQLSKYRKEKCSANSTQDRCVREAGEIRDILDREFKLREELFEQVCLLILQNPFDNIEEAEIETMMEQAILQFDKPKPELKEENVQNYPAPFSPKQKSALKPYLGPSLYPS